MAMAACQAKENNDANLRTYIQQCICKEKQEEKKFRQLAQF